MSDWQGLNFPQETSKERAERVQAAKKKLKSFRAKQNALSSSQFSSTASIDATSPPPISTRSTPTESPNPHIQHERKESRSKHAHRRSKSTNKFIPALHAPPQVNAEFQGQGHYGAAPGFAFPQNPNQQHFSRPSNSHTRRPSSKSYGVGGSHAHKRSKNSSISISVSKLRPQSQSGVGFKNNVFLQPKFNSSAESVSSQASATSGNGSVKANGNGRATGNLNSNWTFPRSPSSEMSNSEASPSTPRGGGGVIGGHSHKRTMSRHRRVGSVSNRSDSLSIMGGLPVSQALSLLSIPPHPVTSNQSTPTASPNPAGLGEMDTRLGFPVAPGLGGGMGAHGLRKSWGGERMSALAKLEGRMRNSNASSNYGGSDDVIDLESCSDENVSMSSPAGVGYGAERGAGLGRRPGSWSHAPGQGSLGGGPGGLGLGIGGGEGARELGMLVEEDEGSLAKNSTLGRRQEIEVLKAV
ncbi:hypothetical protein BT69DRAFT_677335 [Atractiella rhizophila]|nr:hypothetical protein BT69DRAFT_677335 [Atractiella rhizophila]